MDEMDLADTLEHRVNGVRHFAEIDLSDYQGDIVPPAIRLHYKGLDCLIFPEAADDATTGGATLSIEVSWWNWGIRGSGPVVYTYQRDRFEERDPID